MDLDTPCVPLGHIQTYFDLRKSIEFELDWLERRVRFPDDQIKAHQGIIELITGINQATFYRQAGIPHAPGVIDAFITPRQVLALVDQAVNALKMPYLGLAMGGLMTATHHGMAGLAAVTQPTLRGCLEAIRRFCGELFPVLDMDGVPGDVGQDARFIIREVIPMAPYTHYFMELNMVSFYNIFKHLVNGDHELTSADFCYPEPPWSNIYRRYFQCPVRFNQPVTCLRGPAELEHYELPMANRLMAMNAERTLFENIPTRAIRMLPLRLRRLLTRCYGAFPSVEDAASELGMSSRTLRRRLAEEGTSYMNELDTVREQFAREYFDRGGNSVTEIAMTLGFSDSSAFAKAFRRWTGVSPSGYQDGRVQDVSAPEAHNPSDLDDALKH